MIIYGTRAAQIGALKSDISSCTHCSNQGTVTFYAFRKHAHIFWIPLFPIGKKYFTECEHCKIALEPKEIPESVLKEEFQKFKKETKGPIWQFSGTFIIIALIFYAFYLNKSDKEQELLYLNNPQQGDVYTYKVEAGEYSTFKIDKVNNDSIYIIQNDYIINKSSKIYKIDKPENYTESAVGISRDNLIEIYESDEITDISRD